MVLVRFFIIVLVEAVSLSLPILLVNFERLDDAVRARKALNGRDVLGSDVGAIRIGFARVPVKSGASPSDGEEGATAGIQGVGELTVGATIHTLRGIKGASAVAADQQVLGGAVENYRSNLLLSMLGSISILNSTNGGVGAPVTEQQMIMKLLGDAVNEPEVDLSPLAGMPRPMAPFFTDARSLTIVLNQSSARLWRTTPPSLWLLNEQTPDAGMRPNYVNYARGLILVPAQLRK